MNWNQTYALPPSVVQAARLKVMDAEDAALTEGFHRFEPDNDIRWTDGDAALPVSLFDGSTGPLELTLRIGGRTSYQDEGATQRAA